MEDNDDKEEIDDDLINDTIETLENFLFGKSGDCGEKLFLDFAKENKKHFANANLGKSTENNFLFSELFKNFQNIYEKKLEEIINSCGLSSDQFYKGLSKRCEEDDQEIILFVDIMNEIINYNSKKIYILKTYTLYYKHIFF